MGTEFIVVFVGRNWSGKVSILELASFNNFSGLQATGLVPNWPVSGPGLNYSRGNIGLVYERQRR